MESTVTEIIFIVVMLAIYFFPTSVAFMRGHRSRWAIVFVNLFLGWLLIGWLAAMIWSLTGNVEPRPVRAGGGPLPDENWRD